MPILSWIAAKLTGEAIKAGGEIAKTATEIPKNIVETHKAHLEVDEINAKRAERERLIVPATFEEVKYYDPKVKRLHQVISIQACGEQPKKTSTVSIMALLSLVALCLFTLWRVVSWLTHHLRLNFH